MRGDEFCHRLSIPLLAVEAELQRLDSSQQKKAIEWSQRVSFGVLQEIDFLSEILVTHDDGSGSDVVVSTQILRRGVQNDVRAQVERILQVRRHRTVVNAEQCIMRPSDLGNLLKIHDSQQRVCR